MTVEIFATTPNQGITTLNGALTNSATSMPVDSIANLGLTGLTSPAFAYLRLTKITNWRKHPINNPATFEIVKLTAVSGDTGTIVRGQDSTSGIAFADGDIVECMYVSAHYQHIVDALTDGTKELNIGVLTQEAWTAPSYVNSWVDSGGAFTVGGYRKTSLGKVELQGTVKDGTIGTAMFTLPTGYRPGASLYFAIASNDLFGQVNILSDGRTFASVGSNGRFALDGISFDI